MQNLQHHHRQPASESHMNRGSIRINYLFAGRVTDRLNSIHMHRPVTINTTSAPRLTVFHALLRGFDPVVVTVLLDCIV